MIGQEVSSLNQQEVLLILKEIQSLQPDRTQNKGVLEDHKQNINGRSKHSGKARTYKRATRATKQGDRTFGNLFSKEPKERVLGALLHSDFGRVDGGVGDEYYLDYKGMRRKKKRRGKSI
jgi:hypothetical protein